MTRCEGFCGTVLDTIYVCACDHSERLGAHHVYQFCFECWAAHRDAWHALEGDNGPHREVMQ